MNEIPHGDQQDAGFVNPKRLVPVVTFVPENSDTTWEQRIQQGKALRLWGAFELQRVRNEVEASMGDVDKFFTESISGPTVQVAPAQETPPQAVEVLEGDELPDLLYRYRVEQAHMTQADLAQAAGLDVTTISRLEDTVGTRYKPPRIITLTRLVRGFGWSEEDPRSLQLKSFYKSRRRVPNAAGVPSRHRGPNRQRRTG
ncbi:MAG TPA: helix-turn-helix transcriptional regulator [Candidatus Saccharimonadales bacterium]|nr:helix-turn-helix transcriptional regulator [Candidatus Saccharimonadales bacterium]